MFCVHGVRAGGSLSTDFEPKAPPVGCLVIGQPHVFPSWELIFSFSCPFGSAGPRHWEEGSAGCGRPSRWPCISPDGGQMRKSQPSKIRDWVCFLVI